MTSVGPPPSITTLLRQISEEGRRGALSPTEKGNLKDLVVAGDLEQVQL